MDLTNENRWANNCWANSRNVHKFLDDFFATFLGATRKSLQSSTTTKEGRVLDFLEKGDEPRKSNFIELVDHIFQLPQKFGDSTSITALGIARKCQHHALVERYLAMLVLRRILELKSEGKKRMMVLRKKKKRTFANWLSMRHQYKNDNEPSLEIVSDERSKRYQEYINIMSSADSRTIYYSNKYSLTDLAGIVFSSQGLQEQTQQYARIQSLHVSRTHQGGQGPDTPATPRKKPELKSEDSDSPVAGDDDESYCIISKITEDDWECI